MAAHQYQHPQLLVDITPIRKFERLAFDAVELEAGGGLDRLGRRVIHPDAELQQLEPERGELWAVGLEERPKLDRALGAALSNATMPKATAVPR